jgi:hypothetical protein
MARPDELFSEEFARFEQRGRGWQVWPQPVQPEPPFEEFTGYRLPSASMPDDGRKPAFLASLFDSLQTAANPKPPVIPEETVESEPVASQAPLTVEFVASLPAKLDIGDDAMRAVVDSLEARSEPIAFELFGRGEQVLVRFVASASDAPVLQRQLSTFVPEVPFIQSQPGLSEAWGANDGIGFIVDFGLAHEFMLSLQSDHRLDPFLGLVAVLSELAQEEVAVFQVLFQPVQHAWAASVWRSVTDGNGKALFVNRPHLIPGTKDKLESPLFGAVVRLAAKAETLDRAANIVRDLASALRAYSKMESNRLIPLTNDEYPFDAHEEDLLSRQSRRSGMLLNREELIGFVHLPSDDVRSPKLRRQSTRTKSAPASVCSPAGILLGTNAHAAKTTAVRLTPEQRVRHTHIVGATGTGKSTLMFNLIRQDIEASQGVGVLDPHGELVEKILGIIPAYRIDDVVLFDPSDEEFSVGFNILSAHSDFEKTLLASDLVSVFRRLCSSWGDQMGSVLNNAILAFLESSRGGTLADMRRFFLDTEFRNRFLETVRDPDIAYYWRKGFPQLGGNKSIGPVLTRLETFLSPKPIRYMVSQQANKLDFANILDSGKIFLAKLPQGQIGKENSFLLGSLIMAKFQQMAMSRQRMSAEKRRDFFVYLDEFQNFITPSMAEILTGARKYRVGLILAHQELHQLQRDSEVASALLSNPYTRIVFRVGDADAHALEKGFTSFTGKDLQNLGTGEAICRIERSDADFNLSVSLPDEPDATLAKAVRDQVITASRKKYATPRAEVEAALFRAADEKPVTKPVPETKPVEAKPQEAAAKETVAPPPPPRIEPKTPSKNEVREVIASPADMGIGGAQHRVTQKRIKQAAEALGFLATIEKPIPGGSVDVLLERGGQTIACEIGVTTPVDHEFGNVTKCLQAGFSQVAMISRPERLRKIAEAVSTALGTEIASRVGYYTPDDFITHLKNLPVPVVPAIPPVPTETIRRGRKVTVKARKLTPEERRAKEALHLKVITEAMRNKSE